VDDEPRILKGLQRMLRKMRHEWIMAFAESGNEALAMLAKYKFDVIVSDMRMPGMDGSQLLSNVQEKYPLIVRIVLSGHSDHKMILKSVRPAHQYLSKPCDPELLHATIGRACALRDILTHESLKRIVSQTEFIPSLPSIYTQVVEELRSPDGSIKKVGEIIAKDLAMTAKILQLVNSAFFGTPSHVSNPGQAVQLLGLDTVKALVLSIGVFSKFDGTTPSTRIIENIYRHSIKTGTLARKIATKENGDREMVDNTFMAGMLHDLGKLVLIANFPEKYQKIFELSRHENLPFHQAELEIIGATHAEVGAYLLGLWGLPDSIVEGVAFHHNPGNCPNSFFTPLTAVYAANILENHCHGAAGEGDVLENFNADYVKKFDLHEKISAWKNISQQIELEACTNE
jgi:putative nucleotidyltransferase with HDIG domain